MSSNDMLLTLARRYAFGDLAALSSSFDRQIAAFCVFGQRIFDLDAEDFGTGVLHNGAQLIPKTFLARARACRMPQTAKEQPRGALESLRPAYRLLLEVLEARWRRRELSALIATVHIAAEYLPLLAWEPVLGHAGDPARWPSGLTAAGSRFGVIGDRACAHSKAEQSACDRTLRVQHEPPPGWQAYLDRQHSNVAGALGRCVAACRRPCTAIDWITDASLAERCRVARDFGDSAIVRLRHAAPVGHGFGVPEPEEVQDAWDRSRASMAKGPIGEAVRIDDGYVLPGMPSLFSAISGASIEPDTLLADTAGMLSELITRSAAPS